MHYIYITAGDTLANQCEELVDYEADNCLLVDLLRYRDCSLQQALPKEVEVLR